MYKNGENITKLIKANGHKVYQMTIKDIENLNSKSFLNIQKLEGLV
jgi:hypothetical protein